VAFGARTRSGAGVGATAVREVDVGTARTAEPHGAATDVVVARSARTGAAAVGTKAEAEAGNIVRVKRGQPACSVQTKCVRVVALDRNKQQRALGDQ
jgi:hypothetical protein